MTAVIGFVYDDSVYLAGERGNSDMNSILPSLSPKVTINGPYVFGYAGTTGIAQSIAYGFNFIFPPAKTDIYPYLLSKFIPSLRLHIQSQGIDVTKEEDATEILLGYENRLFEISTYDFQCVEYQVSAIGSGKDFALGAYHAIYDYEHPIDIARVCIEAANRFSTTCTGKIDIVYT